MVNNFATALKNLVEHTDTPVEAPLTNFINNEFVASTNLMDSFNPARGEPWIKIPNSTKDEVNSAIEAANVAFKSWKNTSVNYRSNLMNKLADLLEKHIEDLAIIESRDQGKPVSLSRVVDIPRCIHNFRAFASAVLYQTSSSTIQNEPVTAVNYVKYDPIGVAGLISPWNLPLYLLSFKIAPALAAGNTVVCKPSEMTSVTAWLLMHAIRDVGFPAGVVNLVIGEGRVAGQTLVEHPDVPLISFTGSTLIGKMIQEKGAKLNKKISLEMGGKNAAIVYANYNEEDIALIAKSCFLNQGEICLCTSRLFVQRQIYEEFLRKFVDAAKMYTVGEQTDNVSVGALISEQHFNKVKSYIEIAEKDGGIIHCGGVQYLKGHLEKGYFIAPTVISGLADDSKCMTDEIFGPVVCVTPFDSQEEVIERANSTQYGLSATVWSKDVNELMNTANALRAGTVWCNTWLTRDLNMPFGGCKQSGLGREGVHDSLHFYADAKTICIRLNQ